MSFCNLEKLVYKAASLYFVPIYIQCQGFAPGQFIICFIMYEDGNDKKVSIYWCSFDEFLMDMKQNKRKNIRQERKKVVLFQTFVHLQEKCDEF